MQGLQGKPVPVGGNARFLRVMEQYSKASAAVREAEIAVAAGADEKILYDALGELTLLNETVADGECVFTCAIVADPFSLLKKMSILRKKMRIRRRSLKKVKKDCETTAA